MDDAVFADLERAVRAKSTLLAARKTHKEKTDALKEKRQQLLMRATEFIEGSPMMDQVYRDLDAVDQQEYELHRSFQNTLRSIEDDINRTVLSMVERRFGHDWDSSQID